MPKLQYFLGTKVLKSREHILAHLSGYMFLDPHNPPLTGSIWFGGRDMVPNMLKFALF